MKIRSLIGHLYELENKENDNSVITNHSHALTYILNNYEGVCGFHR